MAASALLLSAAVMFLATACAITPPAEVGTGGDPWATANHDATRSSVSATALEYPLAGNWGLGTARLLVPHYTERSSPAIDGWELYVATTSAQVLSYELYTGKMIWSVDAGGPVEASPSSAGRELCLGSIDGVMRCLSRASGAELWRYQARTEITSSPLILESMVVFTSSDDRVYALDRTTGAELWNYSRGTFRTVTARTGASPAYSDGRVFQVFSDSTLVAISSETGRELWSRKIGVNLIDTQQARRTPLVSGARVYVINDSNSVASYSAATGELSEVFSTGSDAGALVDFLIAPGGDIIMGSTAQVASIGLGSGVVRWTAGIESGSLTSLITAGDHVIAVSNYTTPRRFFKRTRARIESIDMKTGKAVWSRTVRTGVTAPPVVAGNMLAYITDKGDLRVLSSKREHER